MQCLQHNTLVIAPGKQLLSPYIHTVMGSISKQKIEAQSAVVKAQNRMTWR